MASLRKKTDAAIVADPPPVAADSEATPSPAPAPLPTPELASPPQDEASQALLRQLEAIKQGETMQQQSAVAVLAAQERRKSWFESTPAAKDHLQELNILHQAALNAGLADTSPEYFDFMSQQLANLQRPAAAATGLADEMRERVAHVQPPPQPEPQPITNAPRPSMVSAPVSREVPNGSGRRQSGKVTLTPQEVEFARVSNVSLEEYAKQKLRLEYLRETGQYSEEQRR
jgi:hypothetical protein